MASYFKPWHHPFILASVSALIVLIAMLLNLTSTSPFLFLSNFTTHFDASYPIVTNTRTGVGYRGTSTNGIEHFQNIFYAEDTSGPNRFAPPVPYTPPLGTIVDATAAGAWCPQGKGPAPLPFTSPINNVSENCLSLRIARPAGITASAKLPVLVWLHGGRTKHVSRGNTQQLTKRVGGDALGSASDQLYQPDGLVRQAKANGQPVIYVGINYRLGSMTQFVN